jgi:CRISPR-associated protein Cmx8
MSPDDPRKPWRHEVKATDATSSSRETPEYQDERRKVCSTLFLELRSRNDEDFVRHFTATLGSVAQYISEDEYLTVAAALMRSYADDHRESRPRTRDDVKTLTLLALSANSRSLIARSEADANGTIQEETEE